MESGQRERDGAGRTRVVVCPGTDASLYSERMVRKNNQWEKPLARAAGQPGTLQYNTRAVRHGASRWSPIYMDWPYCNMGRAANGGGWAVWHNVVVGGVLPPHRIVHATHKDDAVVSTR